MTNDDFGGRPVCVLISDANFVAFNLVEFLLSQHCVVFVYSNQPEIWAKELAGLKDNEFLKIFSLKNKIVESADYLFFTTGFSSNPSLVGMPAAISLAKKTDAKFFVILPFVLGNDTQEIVVKSVKEKLEKTPCNATTVYLGEVFGPRMENTSNWLSTKLILEAAKGEDLTATLIDDEIYPVFIGDAIRTLVKACLSYGFDKNETVLANRVSVSYFIDKLTKINPRLDVSRSSSREKNKMATHSGFFPLEIFSDKDLKKTLVWLSRTKKVKVEEVEKNFGSGNKKDEFTITLKIPQINLPRIKFEKPTFAKLKLPPVGLFLSLGLVSILAVPYMSLGVSALFLKGAYKSFTNDKIERIAFLAEAADKSATFSLSGMRVFSSIPLVGKWLGYGFDASLLAKRASLAAKRAFLVSSLSTQIVQGVFGDKDYDLQALSENLALELEALYKETSFLEGEGKSFGLKLDELTRLRFYADNSLDLVRNLPDLLGEEKQKTYLILFQNNMELRATGGFIGSFALATFDKGQLLDLNVMDVYSADGQLKGHVEPPLPIKYYLGEANWFLRDANWDPDFSTSANQIEWFLDKELDRSVDGVIAVDLEVAKSILDQVGPVELPDFNQTIDSKNLYERVQYEVEEDFFPGSRKKANLLSALASAMMTKITNAENTDYVSLSKSLLNNLNQRHVQIFLHNREAANDLSDLGWAGELKQDVCSGNCATSWFGEVEANVGVNKANYFVTRQMALTSQLDKNGVKNSLAVDLTNSAPAALGNAGKYKSYVRVVLPRGVDVGEVVVTNKNKKETKKAEIFEKAGRIEAGVLVEVSSSERTTITFSWSQKVNLDFTKPGEYRVYLRKQAGTNEDGVTEKIV